MRTEHTRTNKCTRVKQEADEQRRVIAAAFREAFPTVTHAIEEKVNIHQRVKEAFKRTGMSKQEIMRKGFYIPGHSINESMRNGIVAFEAANRVISTRAYDIDKIHFEKIRSDPQIRHALRSIWGSWVQQLEARFRGLISFSKKLPGFSDLCMEDRMILLKTCRFEAMVVLM